MRVWEDKLVLSHDRQGIVGSANIYKGSCQISSGSTRRLKGDVCGKYRLAPGGMTIVAPASLATITIQYPLGWGILA